MIELLNPQACTGCNVCVRACPNNVFQAVPASTPQIARPADCHTCFLCELYCPVDAIYVSPTDALGAADAHGGAAWGSYASASGWRKGLPRSERKAAHD